MKKCNYEMYRVKKADIYRPLLSATSKIVAIEVAADAELMRARNPEGAITLDNMVDEIKAVCEIRVCSKIVEKLSELKGLVLDAKGCRRNFDLPDFIRKVILCEMLEIKDAADEAECMCDYERGWDNFMEQLYVSATSRAIVTVEDILKEEGLL